MANITVEDDFGCSLKFTIEDQENVPIETIIIMAINAAIGIIATKSPKITTKISKNTPAAKVDKRPRPPDLTFIMD